MMTKVFALIFLFLSTITSAGVLPSSFQGEFKVGECNLTNNSHATITEMSDLLVAEFDLDHSVAIYLTPQDTGVQNEKLVVTYESFSVTNEVVRTSTDGSTTVVQKVRFARSATGNRVRIYIQNNANETFECVLYRQK